MKSMKFRAKCLLPLKVFLAYEWRRESPKSRSEHNSVRLRHNWFELEQNHLKSEHNSARLRHNTSKLEQNSDAPVANRSLLPNCSCYETLHGRVPYARKAKEVARGAQASWIHIASIDSFNFTCSCPCEVIHS